MCLAYANISWRGVYLTLCFFKQTIIRYLNQHLGINRSPSGRWGLTERPSSQSLRIQPTCAALRAWVCLSEARKHESLPYVGPAHRSRAQHRHITAQERSAPLCGWMDTWHPLRGPEIEPKAGVRWFDSSVKLTNFQPHPITQPSHPNYFIWYPNLPPVGRCQCPILCEGNFVLSRYRLIKRKVGQGQFVSSGDGLANVAPTFPNLKPAAATDTCRSLYLQHPAAKSPVGQGARTSSLPREKRN